MRTNLKLVPKSLSLYLIISFCNENNHLPLRANFLGLIPLVVFILAESLFETTTSAIISVSCGLIIFAVQYIRERFLDKFLIIDIIVLSILGAATALFKSELFLKLKPGFTQTLFLIYLGIIVFGSHDVFKQFTERFSLVV